MMGAQFFDAEELAITEDESKQLAAAINGVTELYDIGIVNEKAYAWVQLTIALGTVYGGRIVAISRRKRNDGPKLRVMP